MTIKKLCDNDPAVAIKALIDGLLRADSIKDFELDFNSHGQWENGVCYGGAATLTLIELLDMSFAAPQLNDLACRTELMWTDVQDLIAFEKAMYYFNAGGASEIEEYFELPISGVGELGWNLHNENWKNELPKIIRFWEQLTGQAYSFLDRSLAQRWENAVMISLLPPPTAEDCIESLVAQGWSLREAEWEIAKSFSC